MFQVGQLVVCVDDSDNPACPRVLTRTSPKRGEIYRVREIVDNDAILLDEIINPPAPFNELAFYAWRFRPLQDGAIDFARELVAPRPKVGA